MAAEAEAQRERERAARRAEQAEAKRLADAEAARAAAAAEAEQDRRIALQRQRQLRQLQGRYLTAIRQKIERNWRKPPGARDIDCTVLVKQGTDGTVLDVSVESCAGGSAALRNSVANAVWASSPLPAAPDRAIFERQVRFFFRPS